MINGREEKTETINLERNGLSFSYNIPVKNDEDREKFNKLERQFHEAPYFVQDLAMKGVFLEGVEHKKRIAIRHLAFAIGGAAVLHYFELHPAAEVIGYIGVVAEGLSGLLKGGMAYLEQRKINGIFGGQER